VPPNARRIVLSKPQVARLDTFVFGERESEMTLKVYEVLLKRPAIVYTTTFVTAEDEDEAENKAMAEAKADENSLVWCDEEFEDDDDIEVERIKERPHLKEPAQ
jgi:hypothetical protein